jgi:hypothetical protein
VEGHGPGGLEIVESHDGNGQGTDVTGPATITLVAKESPVSGDLFALLFTAA